MMGRRRSRLRGGADTFLVHIAKEQEDQKLGCVTVSLRYQNQIALCVENVGPGLLATWNQQNHPMQVTKGHYIVDINGESEDTEAMYAAIAECMVLNMEVANKWP